MTENDIIPFLLGVQAQLKVLHWQTKSYARHKAYGDTYEALDGSIDEFVEVLQGRRGKNLEANGTIQILNANDKQLEDFLDATVTQLESLGALLSENETELLNLRDEMLAGINKLRYLLTLS